MRARSLIRNSILATSLAFAFAAPVGMAMAQDTSNQTVPGKAADAWITTKVKSEFATAKGISSTDISVTTTEGVVSLSGTVASSHIKKHAVHIAKQVKGVKSVDASGLTVSTTQTPASSTPASSSSTGT